MKKIISILGSTGSIGLNSLKIFKTKKNLYSYNLFAADKNYKLICEQIKEFKPKIFLINNEKIFNKVKKKFKKNKVKIINQFNKNNFIFKLSDITIAAIPGIAGLEPTIIMTQQSKKILIANKESIICGWNLINKAAKKINTKIIPIDSEHFSIMKLLENQKLDNVRKIYITASGGPFLNHKLSKLKKVNPNAALKHPKWKMGKKISIDSASLMNKMLELIEAEKLFSVNLNKFEVVIHPESLVHAIVEFNNGIHKLLYHETTMIIPLANAIFDNNFDIDDVTELNNKKKFSIFNNLTFLKVDSKRFPIINLKNRINEYYSSPIIINAVNEILVDQFLKKKIGFMSFYKRILDILNDRNYKKYAIRIPKNINQVFQIDKWARDTTYAKLK
jgi:1-deoxy-D-xylulose-5-phosphate reductoisomerase